MMQVENKKKSFVTSLKRFFEKNWLSILAVIVLIIIWQVAVDMFHIKKYVLPSPKLVFLSLFNSKNHWWKHIGSTALEIFGSFGLTIAAGLALAIIISWSKWLNKLLMPVIVLFNSIPKIALAPIFLLWFGYGIWPNILISFTVAFFPVVINATTGMTSVDDDLMNLVRYLNATKLQEFIKIRIPNSLPNIFAAVKISATMCVVGSIVGEFVASKSGVGYLLRDAQARIDMPTMFACLFVLAIMGLSFFGFISLLEYVIMPYKARQQQEEE